MSESNENNDIVEMPGEFSTDMVPFSKGHVIYFLMQGDYVAYVGQTTHLAARVAQHVVDGKQFNEVAYVGVDRNRAMYVEAVNIKFHNPELNVNIPKDSDIKRWRAKLESKS